MTQRKLAAIMFSDIVGYTALMGKDETLAFKVLRLNREIHKQTIEKYQGEFLKEMGDGILAIFQSSSDAVRCAVEIQLKALKAEISLRIGIHEGEVVSEEGEILGDGVNIASRLEESCESGEIQISEAVYNNLRNKPDIRAEFMQEATFKNVDHPIRVYRIHYLKPPDQSIVEEVLDGDPQITEEQTTVSPLSASARHSKTGREPGKPKAGKTYRDLISKKPGRRGTLIAILGFVILIIAYLVIFRKDKFESIKDTDGRISIAVMPFRNLSGDTLYNWWQVGIQNILITELSDSRELTVRQNEVMNLALESKKTKTLASITPVMAGQIASELNVKTFVMGSILQAGEKVRLTTQLIKTESGEIFKTFELDGKSEDDFFRMTDSLSIVIKNFFEIQQLTEKFHNPDIHRSAFNTQSAEAFKYYIFAYEDFIHLDLSSAADWYLKSIEKDPDFISAYIGLIFTFGISRNDDQGRKYLELAKALQGEVPIKEQLRLEHLNAYFNENPEEEIKYLNQLLELDEMNPTNWFLLGRAHQKLRQYPDAIACWEKTLQIYNNWNIQYTNWWIYYWLGDAYHQVGDHKKEEAAYDQGLRQEPGHPLILRNQAICAISQDPVNGYGYSRTLIDEILANENFDFNNSSLTAFIYEKAGILDSAEYYYRQALERQPDNTDKMIELARFLIDHDLDIPEGMVINEQALALQPDNWYALDAKGWGLYKMGEYEQALKVLSDAWPLRPSSALTFGYLHLQAVEKALKNQ